MSRGKKISDVRTYTGDRDKSRRVSRDGLEGDVTRTQTLRGVMLCRNLEGCLCCVSLTEEVTFSNFFHPLVTNMIIEGIRYFYTDDFSQYTKLLNYFCWMMFLFIC